MIFQALLLLFVGLLLLIGGAEFLVKGAATFARRLGISTFVIGMTVVAFGTSTPELVVAIGAATRGADDIALGNVIGSNIANIGLVLGFTALVYPIVCSSEFVAREVLVMLAVTAVTIFALWDDTLARHEGLAFLVAFGVFAVMMFRRGKAEGDEPIPGLEEEMEKTHGVKPEGADIGVRPANWIRDIAFVLLGIIGLVFGGDLVVNSAQTLAREFGVSERIIALTLVAVGTSLPELVVSVIAAIRRHPDMVIGNVIGSNIYNLLLVAGATAAVAPPVHSNVGVDLIVMLGMSLACLPIVLSGGRISRSEGALLLVAYLAYIILTFTLA